VPQLALSVVRSAHVPLHWVRPAAHVQVPLWHDWSVGHACPHEPQLALSVLGSTHTPLHWSAGQAGPPPLAELVSAPLPPLAELLVEPPFPLPVPPVLLSAPPYDPQAEATAPSASSVTARSTIERGFLMATSPSCVGRSIPKAPPRTGDSCPPLGA
jgi:hypothetical protein